MGGDDRTDPSQTAHPGGQSYSLQVGSDRSTRSGFWRTRALRYHGLDSHGRPRPDNETAETADGLMDLLLAGGPIAAVGGAVLTVLAVMGRKRKPRPDRRR